MATAHKMPPNTIHPSVQIPTQSQYKPVKDSPAIKGLNMIAASISMLGAIIIFISPLAIIAFITFFGDRFVGTPHPDSFWFVLTTFSKMGAICLVILATVGAVYAFIFVFSNLIKLSAQRLENRSPQEQNNTEEDRQDQSIGIFDRRVAKEYKSR